MAGCAPLLGFGTDPAGLTARVSELILEPDIGCDALKRGLRVDSLPVVNSPAEVGLEYEELWLPAEDASVLRVWRIPSPSDRGTVLLSMGASGDMSCYLFVTLLLVEHGWSVVMYDYRGFGRSTGNPSLATLVPDARVVFDWTLRRTKRARITLMGLSLGTIPSVALAVERPEAVNGVVLDSPLALGEQFKRLPFLFGGMPDFYSARLPAELRSEELISGLLAPLLVFVGSADPITPESTVAVLFDRAPEPKELVRFEGLTHAAGPYFATSLYTYHLESFLSSIWSARDDLE